MAGTGAGGRLLRAIWCTRAYRDFEGLYDVTLIAVTQDRDREALVSRLSMQGAPTRMRMALGAPLPRGDRMGAVIWIEVLSRHHDVVAR